MGRNKEPKCYEKIWFPNSPLHNPDVTSRKHIHLNSDNALNWQKKKANHHSALATYHKKLDDVLEKKQKIEQQ